jgi:hypothetical protein
VADTSFDREVERNFTRYIAAMAVARMGTMAGAFYLVYGVERFQLGGEDFRAGAISSRPR